MAAAGFGLVPIAGARSEQWKNAKGDTFEASPSDVLGPWALFDNGTLLPLSLLSNEDCVRFYEGLKERPARAADWKLATSKISKELYGRLLRYEGTNMVGDNENGRQEPEFFMMFYTTNDKHQSWDMLSRSTPDLYSKMEKDYPGMVQGVVFGVAESMADHFDVATNTKGTWMFTQFSDEVQMRALQLMIPSTIYGIVVMTRDGVPLFGPEATTDEQVKAIFEKFTGMLGHMKPDDPHVWVAQAHYLRAVQPVAYANGKSDPVLVGNPLVEARLRQMKIFQVDATFQIAADGSVKSVEVKPDNMPPNMVSVFATGFKRGCIFVPAVDHGKFVDGTYVYHMEIPR